MPRTSLKERNDRHLVDRGYGMEYVVPTPDGLLHIDGEKTDTGEIFIRLPRGFAGLPHKTAVSVYEILKELIDK